MKIVYKYLTSFGGLWRLSDIAYARFLKDVAAGKEWNLNDYGTMISGDLITVTDLTPEQARSLLKEGESNV